MSLTVDTVRHRAKVLGLEVRQGEALNAGVWVARSALNHDATLQYAETLEQLDERVELFASLPELARAQFLLGLRGECA